MPLPITISCRYCDQHCQVLDTAAGTTTTVYCPQCERRYGIVVAEHVPATSNPWTRPLSGVTMANPLRQHETIDHATPETI